VEKSSAVIFVLQVDKGKMDGVSIVTNTGVEMGGLGVSCSSGQTDSDHESVVSDYSEMADPVKEHLASIHILQEAELRFGSALGLTAQQTCMMRPWLAIQRRPDEDEMEFLQRQRKMNFLSLAQEFAAIKKANPDALPFNLHKQRNNASSKEENEESDDVSLAQEFAAVSCVDKRNDEDSEVEASCSEQVHDCSGFHSTDNNKHVTQSSDVVTNGCSSSILCAAEEDCNSELAVMVSSIPDVVQGLHDSDSSKQPNMNCGEVDLVDNCRSSDVLTGFHDDFTFRTSDELANTVVSHSKNVDLVS